MSCAPGRKWNPICLYQMTCSKQVRLCTFTHIFKFSIYTAAFREMYPMRRAGTAQESVHLTRVSTGSKWGRSEAETRGLRMAYLSSCIKKHAVLNLTYCYLQRTLIHLQHHTYQHFHIDSSWDDCVMSNVSLMVTISQIILQLLYYWGFFFSLLAHCFGFLDDKLHSCFWLEYNQDFNFLNKLAKPWPKKLFINLIFFSVI